MENQKLENLRTLGKRAYDNEHYDDALSYFKEIQLENPDDWEANLYVIMSKVKQANLNEFDEAVKAMSYEVPRLFQYNSTFDKLSDKEKLNAIKTIEYEITKTVINFERTVSDFYVKYSSLPGAKSDFTGRILALSSCCGQLGKAIDNSFDNEEIQEICVQPLKNAIALFKKFLNGQPADFLRSQRYNIEDYDDIIRKYEEDYINPYDEAIESAAHSTTSSNSSGGCYVATAVYGSYDCPEVWTLRRYRDDTLAKTWYGRAFIRTYYAVSPTLVKWFGNTEWFRKMWQGKLDSMVKNLQEKGVESTPYEDKNW